MTGRRFVDIEYILKDRRDRDRFLATHYASPLPEEQMEGFAGLDYFPPDLAWRIIGRFHGVAPHKIEVMSSAGTGSPYTQLGSVALEVVGAPYDLIVLDDGDGDPFIPFRDHTCGVESYRGGRYVGLDIATDGDVTVDFNLARNPWCVYDEEFVCPLPPPANSIEGRVAAGEKMYLPREP